MRFEIVFARSARKELERLDATVVRRIVSRLDRLASDPRPSGCVKLANEVDLWRIRVGDYPRCLPDP